MSSLDEVFELLKENTKSTKKTSELVARVEERVIALHEQAVQRERKLESAQKDIKNLQLWKNGIVSVGTFLMGIITLLGDELKNFIIHK